MSILQAAVLGLWYWVTTWYIGYTWGCAVFGDALVTGLVVGIVMGDVPTAMKCAAVIKPMFLAFAGAGGGIVWDEAAATLGGISVTLVSGLDVSQSVTIAVPLSHPPYRVYLPGSKGGRIRQDLQHQRHHVHGCLVAADLQVLPLRHPDVLRPVLRRRSHR